MSLNAQTRDSTRSVMRENKNDTIVKRHSPKKATYLSLVLPGAGQVYNRKNWWWKVPLMYGGGAILLNGAIMYQSDYNRFRTAYKEKITTGKSSDPYCDRFQAPTLQVIRDWNRDLRDQCYVWLVVVYAVQVLDAAVEAHFFDFNMSENVSLNVQPMINIVGNKYSQGIQLTYKF